MTKLESKVVKREYSVPVDVITKYLKLNGEISGVSLDRANKIIYIDTKDKKKVKKRTWNPDPKLIVPYETD